MADEYDPEWVALEKAMGKPSLPDDLEGRRKAFNAALIGASQMLPPTNPDIQTRDEAVNPNVHVRLYTPPGAEGKTLPLIVFYHGGGWQAGTLDTEDHCCRTVCGRVGCIVASVDYRLYPQVNYDVILEEAIEAYQWVYSHASSLGADPHRISAWGGSAGAALAVAVTHHLTSTGQGDRIAGLVVMSGMFMPPDRVPAQYRQLHTSYSENVDVPVVAAEHMIAAYVNIVPTGGDSNVDYFPIVGAPAALKGFPKTYAIGVEKEACRDDAKVLVEGLKDNGTPVKIDMLPGLPHYFWCFPVEKAGAKFRDTLVEGMRWLVGMET